MIIEGDPATGASVAHETDEKPVRVRAASPSGESQRVRHHHVVECAVVRRLVHVAHRDLPALDLVAVEEPLAASAAQHRLELPA